MMHRSLYTRLLVLFLAVLMLAMGILSVMLYQRIRTDKFSARLDELTTQARDVAFLAAQRTSSFNLQTNRYLVWKATQIMSEFDAYVIIIDRARNVIPLGDATIEYSFDFTLEETYSLLSYVVSTGMEMRVRTEMDNGNAVFTVVVPYVDDGRTLGAVFIHTSEQSIEASLREILTQSLYAILVALAIGAGLILVMTRLITQPLREMARAADRFARGDFEQRVTVSSHDEMGLLAESFNHMAEDLDRLEETRRGFVANVSHELRSPLTSMQGFINGILDGTVPEAEREHYLNIVLDETRRLNKLISTLLDLSHIDSGTTELNIQAFDINEMIARVTLRQETRIEDMHLDVQIDFEQEVCRVSADPDRIEQVLINLIDNAIKYGREGGTVTLQTRTEGGLARINIRDDGQGIPPEDLPLVFERFHKVDKAHTTGDGTGLGLAIARSILQQHGQSISATSIPGEDTCFSFTLPLADGKAARAEERKLIE